MREILLMKYRNRSKGLMKSSAMKTSRGFSWNYKTRF